MGGLFKIKHKSHFLLADIDKPPQKIFKNLSIRALSFEYFLDGVKIITNCGFGFNISKKAELLSRLTACQSTLTINETSITNFEKNEMISKILETQFKIVLNLLIFPQKTKVIL